MAGVLAIDAETSPGGPPAWAAAGVLTLGAGLYVGGKLLLNYMDNGPSLPSTTFLSNNGPAPATTLATPGTPKNPLVIETYPSGDVNLPSSTTTDLTPPVGPTILTTPQAAPTLPTIMNSNASNDGQFPTTPPVFITGQRPIDLGPSHEDQIQNMYGDATVGERSFSTFVNGQLVNGVADSVAVVNDMDTAVESKYVDNWQKSRYNSDSSFGQTAFGAEEQQRVIDQAAKYSSGFKVA